MSTIDPRILRPGMHVTVSILVDVYQDHYRGDASVCPGCGHWFPKGDTSDCSTMTVVRPLLRRRRLEDREAAARLTPEQVKDLNRITRTPKTNRRTAVRPAPEPELFDTAPYRRTGGLR